MQKVAYHKCKRFNVVHRLRILERENIPYAYCELDGNVFHLDSDSSLQAGQLYPNHKL